MKSTAIVFSNTIPEIECREKDVMMDFGLVVLELSYIEVASLLLNLVSRLNRSGHAAVIPSKEWYESH